MRATFRVASTRGRWLKMNGRSGVKKVKKGSSIRREERRNATGRTENAATSKNPSVSRGKKRPRNLCACFLFPWPLIVNACGCRSEAVAAARRTYFSAKFAGVLPFLRTRALRLAEIYSSAQPLKSRSHTPAAPAPLPATSGCSGCSRRAPSRIHVFLLLLLLSFQQPRGHPRGLFPRVLRGTAAHILFSKLAALTICSGVM